MLFRLLLLGMAVLVILFANIRFINDLYFTHQLTRAGLVINSGIIAIFVLGLIKIITSLLYYMREETALARFMRRLEAGPEKLLKGVSARSIIAQRYNTLVTLGSKNARINHSAIAATLKAKEANRISFARYVSNILILTGVFGTIVSLSIALVGATDLLDNVQDSSNMGLVIHGMSTALSTTITAILCYLFYGYFYIKLSDAQAHLLSGVEEVTAVHLMPEYARDSDSMLSEVAGLIQGLRMAAEGMQSIQRKFAEAGGRLDDSITGLNLRVENSAEDLDRIKQLLREGFRLPAAGE